MIAIDTSALMAVALGEEEAARVMVAMRSASDLLIGAPTLLEFRMVLTGRFDVVASADLVRLLVPSRASIISFDGVHATVAQVAFAEFGKGQHPASLNFGDCMAYAVAKIADCPLLYKGDDFARTDIRSAL